MWRLQERGHWSKVTEIGVNRSNGGQFSSSKAPVMAVDCLRNVVNADLTWRPPAQEDPWRLRYQGWHELSKDSSGLWEWSLVPLYLKGKIRDASFCNYYFKDYWLEVQYTLLAFSYAATQLQFVLVLWNLWIQEVYLILIPTRVLIKYQLLTYYKCFRNNNSTISCISGLFQVNLLQLQALSTGRFKPPGYYLVSRERHIEAWN